MPDIVILHVKLPLLKCTRLPSISVLAPRRSTCTRPPSRRLRRRAWPTSLRWPTRGSPATLTAPVSSPGVRWPHPCPDAQGEGQTRTRARNTPAQHAHTYTRTPSPRTHIILLYATWTAVWGISCEHFRQTLCSPFFSLFSHGVRGIISLASLCRARRTYALLEEAKNCTFRPKTKKYVTEGDGDSDVLGRVSKLFRWIDDIFN